VILLRDGFGLSITGFDLPLTPVLKPSARGSKLVLASEKV